ncbi:eCIS core domain-containing protein [Nitrospirillum iridis]|uniref:eCIS core domain-containing protein n=1 Tax=Nitrospirillum iridis TaxID=765888 RepID=A0A7X0ATF3_9PROT|nr:DUF4157 domain-containing protein [Nitrospirillum iridis]MBB6249787.1 hypothetical protein [Nitrospirillum iridis]
MSSGDQAHHPPAQRKSAEPTFQRPARGGATSHPALMPLQRMLDDSPQSRRLAALDHMVNQSPPAPVQRRANRTGLPDSLKAGVEQLSGLAMDDVRVHYNSAQPAAVQAHAFAQGSEIHLAPGQDRHLPHEAWHVVQQKQGRVRPTLQLQGISVNDDAGLESEATRMGDAAAHAAPSPDTDPRQVQALATGPAPALQRARKPAGFNSLEIGHAEDELFTNGLANCIAVIAWDRARSIGVMAHFDTLQAAQLEAADSDEEDEGDRPPRTFTFDTAPLERLRNQSLAKLASAPGDGGLAQENVEYRIGLGSLWDVAPLALSRPNLTAALQTVFNVAPVVTGAMMRFLPSTGDLSVLSGHEAQQFAAAWNGQGGDPIQYHAVPGAGAPDGDEDDDRVVANSDEEDMFGDFQQAVPQGENQQGEVGGPPGNTGANGGWAHFDDF